MTQFFASLTCLIIFWSIIALASPKLMLWWADRDRQTQWHCIALGVALAIFFFSMTIASFKVTPLWFYLFPPIILAVIVLYIRLLLTTPEDEVDEIEDIDNHCPHLANIAKNIPDNCPYIFGCECPYIEAETCQQPHGGRFFPCPDGQEATLHLTNNKGQIETIELNTREVSCTCMEWLNIRAEFDALDPKRLCCHLVKAIIDQHLEHYFLSDAVNIKKAYEQKTGYPLL